MTHDDTASPAPSGAPGGRYLIILNGDHAEFEAEWAGKDPKTRPDWPLPSFDAQDWAGAFCSIAQNHGIKDGDGKLLDEGWMASWFANALMRGLDEGRARSAALAPAGGTAGGAPPGYALVPVEPTPAMVNATWNHDVDRHAGVESQNRRNRRVWSAMVAAAPPPSPAPSGAAAPDIVEAARWVSEAFDAAVPEVGTISPRARSSLKVLHDRLSATPSPDAPTAPAGGLAGVEAAIRRLRDLDGRAFTAARNIDHCEGSAESVHRANAAEDAANEAAEVLLDAVRALQAPKVWRPMSEEPIGRPITARMRLGDGSWWYARVRVWQHEDGDGGRFGDHGYELLHYNGEVTLGRFYGPFDSWCEINAALDAALPGGSAGGALSLPRRRHVKRGTVYEEVGRATLQDADGTGISEGDEVVVYRSEDGRLWARERDEFEDGRFARIAAENRVRPASGTGEGQADA